MVGSRCVARLKSGTTVPLFALGSSIHPSFHPRFLVADGSVAGSFAGSEAGEETPLLDGPRDRDEGEPITRKEINRILTGDKGDAESLDSRQEDAMIGEGTGLDDWGRGRVTVFVEGNKLLICDEEGGLTWAWACETRKLTGRQRRRPQDPILIALVVAVITDCIEPLPY